MKQATQTILSSILVIVMCFALITGATFALFSDESEVNIAVNAGKVEVVATAEINGAWSAAWDKDTGKYIAEKRSPVTSDDVDKFVYSNGGVAYMTDDSNIVLSNITPGDGVQVLVTIANKSTVDIQYKVTLVGDGDQDFFNALKVTVTEDEAMNTLYSNGWTYAKADNSKELVSLKSAYVNIELPWEVGNDLKNQSCKIIISVVAYQANAAVQD